MSNNSKKPISSMKKSELISELKLSLQEIKKLEENCTKLEKINNELTKDKEEYQERKAELKTTIEKFKTEIKYLKENVKNIDILNERINFLDSEKQIIETKLNEKEKKIEQLIADKETLLKEKAEVLESKNEILQNTKNKELEIQTKNQKIADLTAKFKKSSSDLLSKSMQIDKLIKQDKSMGELKKNIKTLEEKLEEKENSERTKSKEFSKLKNKYKKEREILTEKITTLEESLSEANLEKLSETTEKVEEENVGKKERGEKKATTRIITNLDDTMKVIKEMLPEGRSNIRLIIPLLEDLKRFDLANILKEIPNKVRINIATYIDNPAEDELFLELKNYCQMTNFNENKFIALNVDSSRFLISIFQKEANKILGIYTEAMEIINLFKSAIMEPFIKGRKIY